MSVGVVDVFGKISFHKLQDFAQIHFPSSFVVLLGAIDASPMVFEESGGLGDGVEEGLELGERGDVTKCEERTQLHHLQSAARTTRMLLGEETTNPHAQRHKLFRHIVNRRRCRKLALVVNRVAVSAGCHVEPVVISLIFFIPTRRCATHLAGERPQEQLEMREVIRLKDKQQVEQFAHRQVQRQLLAVESRLRVGAVVRR